MKTLCQGSAYLKITQYRSSGSAVGRHTGFTASLDVCDVQGVAAGALDSNLLAKGWRICGNYSAVMDLAERFLEIRYFVYAI